MVCDLPEELLEQAKFLLTLPPNQANLRRAVSAAYYGIFHLLIRATVLKWSEPIHHARIARIFEHQRMKTVSGATVKIMRTETHGQDSRSIEVMSRRELTTVVQAFIALQQARHEADYNLETPLELDDAMAEVNRADSAFAASEICRNSNVAKEYLFSLLFREKERS